MAVCKAVVESLAPGIVVADISHLIPEFDVRRGALVLAEAVPWFADAVHLAVVDPGVGSTRRALVVQCGDGSCLVGPDNGLLLPAAERLGGVAAARLISNPRITEGSSLTFHGRDLFAPAAGHLAAGLPPAELGPAVDPESLVRLPEPHLERKWDRVTGEVVQIDRYGNLQTNIAPEDLPGSGTGRSAEIEVVMAGRRFAARRAGTFSDGDPGELLLLEDSHGSLALCMNRGRAQNRIGASVGSVIGLRVRD